MRSFSPVPIASKPISIQASGVMFSVSEDSKLYQATDESGPGKEKEIVVTSALGMVILK